MKKLLTLFLILLLGVTAYGQQKIQLRSADKAECVSSDMKTMKASFSFSGIEAEDVTNDRGTFSWLTMANTVLGGNVGEPQLPVINELIAVPFGATPRIEITHFSSTDYRLEDYGMKTLVPRQLPVRKDQNLDEVPFILNEAAYQTRGLHTEPQAVVSVDGTMRGVQLGTMTIEPVSYDPVNNTLRVFNDIEVEVHFDDADAQATEDMLLRTYSPAFDNVYAQLFNNRAITDVYADHPDLYNTPVKMLVICYSGFQNNSSLNSWLQWKLQKGYHVDIYYTGSGSNNAGTTASAIASFIKNKYNASVSAGNAYTYLIVIGDTGQVPQYMTKTVSYACASDLGYASVNFSSNTNNYFPDMYYSRISVENTTHLTNYINKVLTYEKFEFTDGGNYLNNVILVGGWDSNWTPKVAKPTINYATNNYFKSSNTTYGGFGSGTINATVSTSSSAGYSGTNNGVYNGINNGVCFLNYTAHGDRQEWYQPQMTAAHVATLTNTGKYFFGVGNCCLTGNFNNTSTTYSPGSAIGTNACFAETMIRVPNAGAVAYVGCSPYSYWYEDFYWAVGAHSYSAGNAPSVSGSSKGVYDVMFQDQYWNSASALLYLGNLAVQQAVTNGNTTSGISDGDCNNSAHYYFQFYHCFGDGSVMPYITKPETNTVTIPNAVVPGTSSITVNALAGSYVAVTDNSSVIYGVAEANSSGVATVNFTHAIPATGNLYVVVTRQQYQPWFGTIPVVGGTQYGITCVQPQHGTISAPEQAYATATVTLTANPEAGYCLSSWTVTDANNNSVQVTNNQFIMPESDVTVTATFVTGLQVTLAPATNGTISATPTCALQGTTINLTATPATDYVFDSWVVYKTGDASTTVNVSGDSFEMPNYDVTVVGIFTVPQGGDVTIGGNNPGTSNGGYLPTHVWYKYSLTQQIYTAAEVGTAGTITAISFNYNGSTSSGARTVQVYLSHTSSSTISSWVTQSNSNRVYSGSVTFTQGWNTITLTTPFEYNGTSNLLLTFDDNTGSYSVDETQSFYTYSTGANRAIYYYSDSNNLSATSSNSTSGTKLQTNNYIRFTKEVPSTDGYLFVTPTELSDFITYEAESGSDPQSVAVIGANLQANLTVTAPTGFEVSATQNGTYNSTLTLTPSNGSLNANVFVRLSSSVTPGVYSGNMTLVSGTATATVSLEGEVFPSGEQYTITVNASPEEGGTVTGGGTFYEGTQHPLTATPATHYTFTGWQLNGNIVSTETPYTIEVTSDATYTAIFEEMPQYTVTVSPTEGGTITATPTTAYPGDVVTLSFTPESGCIFTAWYVYHTDNPTDVVEVVDDEWFVMPSSDVTVMAIYITETEQEQTVGSGTSNNTYLPTHVRSNYSLTQQIYLASELENTAGEITKIAFRADVASSTRSLIIYMAHTELNAFSSKTGWEVMGSSAKVFEGSVDFDISDWTVITLDTPFDYDGTSNINLCVVDQSNEKVGTTSVYTQFRRTNAPSRALRAGGNTSYAYRVGSSSQLSNLQGSIQTCVSQIQFTVVVTSSTESLTVTPGEMDNFSYLVGEGPSSSNMIDIVGVDLENDVTLTAPDNFEICLTENGTYSNTLTISPQVNLGGSSPVTMTMETVYVRLKGNLAWGSYSGTLTATAGTGDRLNSSVSLNGEVLRPAAIQTVSLVKGWNWWTPTVAEADLDAFQANLDMREGYILTAQNVTATSLVPGQMYKVWVNNPHSFSLSGYARDSVQVSFIGGSLTCFGFIGAPSVAIGEALGGFTPSEGDMINSLENGFAIYHNGAWEGTLTSLESGYGYVYLSREGNKTVTF